MKDPTSSKLVLCLVAQSYPTLCDPLDCRLFCPWGSQARILEWVATPSSRGSSQPRSPALQEDSLPSEPPGKPRQSLEGQIPLDSENSMSASMSSRPPSGFRPSCVRGPWSATQSKTPILGILAQLDSNFRTWNPQLPRSSPEAPPPYPPPALYPLFRAKPPLPLN